MFRVVLRYFAGENNCECICYIQRDEQENAEPDDIGDVLDQDLAWRCPSTTRSPLLSEFILPHM